MVDDYGSIQTPVNHEGANQKENPREMFALRRILENSWKRRRCALLLAALCVCGSTDAKAQVRNDASASDGLLQGTFPDASFDVTFRKYTPPENVFSPYY